MPDPPGWRYFLSDAEFESQRNESEDRWQQIQELAEADLRGKERGESFRLEPEYIDVVNAVNAALCLRRPLLLTYSPG